MTQSDKEYLDKLATYPNKKGLITKVNNKYRIDVFKENAVNSCARFYTTSLEKAKMTLLSIGVTTYTYKGVR